MSENLHDLAVALLRVAPETRASLSKSIDEHLSNDQKQAISQTQQQLGHSDVRPRAVLKQISDVRPHAVLRRRQSPDQSQPQDHFEQALLATTSIMPHQQFKTVLLSVANERRRQARTIFTLVRIFFIMCLIILVVGILLFVIAPQVAGVLTSIGALLSVVGGLLLNSHQDAHRRLDDIIDKIQKA